MTSLYLITSSKDLLPSKATFPGAGCRSSIFFWEEHNTAEQSGTLFFGGAHWQRTSSGLKLGDVRLGQLIGNSLHLSALPRFLAFTRMNNTVSVLALLALPLPHPPALTVRQCSVHGVVQTCPWPAHPATLPVGPEQGLRVSQQVQGVKLVVTEALRTSGMFCLYPRRNRERPSVLEREGTM